MNTEAIHTIVSEAFEEGARSPYEMKQYVVDELLVKLQSNLSPGSKAGNLQEVANIIAKALPAPVRSIVTNHEAWLCGGSVLRAIVDPLNKTAAWKTSDYDIYCTLEQFKLMPVQAEEDDKHYMNKNKEQFKTYRTVWQGCELNVIVAPQYTNPLHILQDFDLSIVKFAYSERPKPTLVTYRQSWVDVCTGQIHIADPKNRTPQTVNRIKKYIKRGFRDCTGLVETGLLSRLLSETRVA